MRMDRLFSLPTEETSPAVDDAADSGCARHRVLLCAPRHFSVDYAINPWMESQIGAVDHARALAQWSALHARLSACADVELVEAQPALPDMVFTANAGLVRGAAAIVSRFRCAERRDEEAHFHAFFEGAGFRVAPWPQDVCFEGAGDALFDRGAPILWAAHGFRSDRAAAPLLERLFDRRTLALRLVDPRFYHLDTCFCPLSGGWTMYYPGAFDANSRALIEAHVAPSRRVEIDETDALGFACNAVEIDGRIFMNAASAGLLSRLSAAGFRPEVTPLGEFLKSGGGAKCLTLKLTEA